MNTLSCDNIELSLMGMKRYYINDGDIDVHITKGGDKGKPIIFCLHGLGSTSLSFIEIAEEQG